MSDENEHGEEVSYEIIEPNAVDNGKTGMLNSISNMVSDTNNLVSNTNNLVSNVGGLVQAVGSTIQTMQQQKTIREGIKAERDVQIKKIESQTEIIKDIVKSNSSDRERRLKNSEKALDYALEKGDNQALALALGAIVEGQKGSIVEGVEKQLRLGQNNQKRRSWNVDEEV